MVQDKNPGQCCTCSTTVRQGFINYLFRLQLGKSVATSSNEPSSHTSSPTFRCSVTVRPNRPDFIPEDTTSGCLPAVGRRIHLSQRHHGRISNFSSEDSSITHEGTLCFCAHSPEQTSSQPEDAAEVMQPRHTERQRLTSAEIWTKLVNIFLVISPHSFRSSLRKPWMKDEKITYPAYFEVYHEIRVKN